MRTVPERPAVLQILTVFGGFFIGPYAALRMSAHLTPGSELVQTAGVFGFALVFVVGTLWWAGWGVATVVLRGLGSLLRGRRPGPEGLGHDDKIAPPGYGAYVVLGLLVGCLVGSAAGLFTEAALSASVGAWCALGLGYGLLLWTAAHHGFLPFPEPD